MRGLTSYAAIVLSSLLLVAGCPERKSSSGPVAPDARPLPAASASAGQPADVEAVRREADTWRRQRKLIDIHQHVSPDPDALVRAIRILDKAGIGVAVNLSGGTVTPTSEGISAFELTRAIMNELYPGRFLQYMNLDYSRWDEPDFARQAVAQVELGAKLGAAGFKQPKSLGLYLKDASGKVIKVDDPKLDPMWKRCGELGLPVSIHTADPRAFWQPYDPSNERWDELQDHPKWWFGDPKRFLPREELLAELDHLLGRHPETTFVSVHFGSNAEDLAWVDAELDRYPNMLIDVAARVPEIGRHDPAEVRRFFLKHQDRILFGTDLAVDVDDLVLGSGGKGPPPTLADADVFFQKHWRWFETRDEHFVHMTPIQGRWTISGIGLPVEVLRKVYFDNARKLLARSLPPGK